jgi:beta-phosphoglucomutase
MDEMREALVFDYDGVLADTERLHWKSWAALLLRYNIQLTWEEYCRVGRGIDDAQMCDTIRKRAALPAMAELLRPNIERKQIVCDWSLAEVPIPQQTIQLMMTLGAYRVGLVTSSERSEVEPILRAAGIFDKFDATVFGDEVAARKPAPDPYLMIAQKLGVATGIAFEDSDPGVASAVAAGFKVFRVEQPQELAQLVARFLHGQASSRTLD